MASGRAEEEEVLCKRWGLNALTETGINEVGLLEVCGGREVNVEKYGMGYGGDGI